jgi:CheY-like chemotaxis protein/anti-sigma regulatory factor (Ser/Thr protein kinase)
MGRNKKITNLVLSDKEKFLINLSHQIRTPLYSITGLSEILQSSGLDPSQKEYVSHINSAINTLSELVNSLLEFMQLENNTLNLKEDIFSLEEIITKIIKLHKPTTAEKGLKVNYFIDKEIPYKIRGDQSICQILINNIVNNAVKYTYSGQIEIRVNLLEDKLQSVTIEIKVSDTGIGMSPEILEQIFEKPSAPTTDYTESMMVPALGLQISKQLAALMNGTISAQSTEGKGSTFTILLQLKKDLSKAPAKPVKNEEIFFNNLHLLLVEDNRLNQIVTQKILQLQGINVDVADNGKIAVEMLNQTGYDLILMDLQMPVMDGYATTQFIRQAMSAPLNKIPIIAYTAHAFRGEAEKCRAVGMNDYLTKPINTDDLVKKIAALVPGKTNVYSKSEAAQNFKEYKHDSIDLSYLHELSRGNREFVNEVIEVFLKETPSEMMMGKVKLEEKNLDDLYKVIHKLKPSYALMGMHNASEAVLEIQYQCKNARDIEKITDAFMRIQNALNKAIPQLQQQIAS